MVRKEKSFRICIFSFPMASALVGNALLYNLVEILEPICETVDIVTSNIPKDRTFSNKVRINDVKIALHFRDLIHPMWWSTLLQLVKIVFIEMKMCWTLMKVSKEIDTTIFYIGGANLFLPVLMAKILRKKVITTALGSALLCYRRAYNKGFFSMGGIISTILNIMERTNFYLSDRIAVESESVKDVFDLDKYRQKLVPGARYIDTNLFQIKKDPMERKNVIGYIGRLEEGKGVMNFVKAIQLILEMQNNIKFFFGGDGPLYDQIKNELRNSDLSQKVEVTGWLSHDEVAEYLNELRLFILPSYSEGLPTTVLEAMACGTPVLATPVGAIPDVIKDGETGFLMENNSPECIAANVIRALEYPDLDGVTQHARALVEREFTYEKAVERWRRILEEICDDRR